MSTASSRSWICCQIGAREHYAIPRALHERRKLAAFYTDFWAGPATRVAAGKSKSGSLRSLASRFHPGLVDAPVVSWNTRYVLWESALRRRTKRGKHAGEIGNPYFGFMEVGRRFASAVRDSLRRRRDLPRNVSLFAYDTGALETFEWCCGQGIRCVLDQMDPNRVEVDLVREEAKHWPGWELQPLEVPEEYFRRREQEWSLADVVVVNSAFCKQALVRQGLPAEKLFVLPLCYEPDEPLSPTPHLPSRTSDLQSPISKTLRVLFLGQVNLRKGIQYLMAAARKLEGGNICFDVVGPVGISENAKATAPRNLRFHGRANRAQAVDWYREADVFVLPTLSDGFAITQLEAMAHGLPVVTTPCCGDVVSDGLDGFIVPPRDADALANTFQRYLAEPDLWRHQSRAALEKSRRFSLDHLTANLLKLESTMEAG